MTKKKTSIFVCNNCAFQTGKWLGKCPECNEWNTFEEESVSKDMKKISTSELDTEPKKIEDIIQENFIRSHTKISEFDRVLGGGLVPGSLTLVGGEPGIGKSTLLIQVMGKLAENYPKDKILYVSGEESMSQVANRAKRLGISNENLLILNESNWQKILKHIKKVKPRFLVVDSIQTTQSSEIQSAPGTVSQVREVTYELMNHAKSSELTTLVIGHITKEGTIAGPKILEHMVDTVIYFEGDQFGQYRILRAIKNRFGNTNEVGIFEMNENGLAEVKNPSQYFVDENIPQEGGRSITCIMEGTRPLFVEIQALVAPNKFGNGRRTTSGVDNNRLAMLVAVTETAGASDIALNDIYVNVTGGIKLKNREADLSIVASMLRSRYDSAKVDDSIFIGEVGLTGEVRSVPRMEARLSEMTQLNYKMIFCSERTCKDYAKKFPKLKFIPIKNVKQLVDKVIKSSEE